MVSGLLDKMTDSLADRQMDCLLRLQLSRQRAVHTSPPLLDHLVVPFQHIRYILTLKYRVAVSAGGRCRAD